MHALNAGRVVPVLQSGQIQRCTTGEKLLLLRCYQQALEDIDRFPNLKLIASHAGGALPFIASRMDHWHRIYDELRVNTKHAPGDYLGHIYYDAVIYEHHALELCLGAGGAEHVLYGSDYPHKVGDMSGCLARVDALAAGTARAVRGANAERIFAL